MFKLVQTADVTVDSIAFNDPAGSPVEICDATNSAAINYGNCPTKDTGADLLCRLFSIVPLAANTNNLADSTAMVDATGAIDASVFDLSGTTAGAEATAGNADGIVTVIANGCKPNQCTHADGSGTPVTFAYNPTTTIITATCACDKTGETKEDPPTDAAKPFKCVCNEAEERF